MDLQEELRLGGGLFLIYLGCRAWTAVPPSAGNEPRGPKGLVTDYLSTFFLTLTNPITILSFAAIFAGLGLGTSPGDYLSAWLLVLGVFSGSALWWLLLSFGVSFFRERLTPQWMLWINRLSGVVVTAFGVLALVRWAMG